MWGEDEELHSDNAMSCEINDPGNKSVLENFQWVKAEKEPEPKEWW